MSKKNATYKFQKEMLCLEDLVREEHLVRKLEKVIDLDFIRPALKNARIVLFIAMHEK
ncbi:hypothetical protein [Tissierella sp.]|uniref:hypothetical protein n=1 Tax=Tissierella sp. TaxID=41274 RepID=UPI0030D83A35